MRRIISFITLFLIFILISGCGKTDTHELEGTWVMESGIYTDLGTDQKIETQKTKRFAIKIISPTHFAVVEMFKDKPDSLFFAAVGTYELTPDKYRETYNASNFGYQVGTSREFDYSLEGNHWSITRSDQDMKLQEVWIRQSR